MNSKTRSTYNMRGYEQTTYHVNSKDEVIDGEQGMNYPGSCCVMDPEYMVEESIKDRPGVESGLSSVDNLYDHPEYLV